MDTLPRRLSTLPSSVCIVGGGGTGAALAYDLTLRGFRVTLLERGELTSGTTGRHHGQLHSGARYAVRDRAIARECMEETRVLRRIVPEAIEYNGGLFLALTPEEENYAPDFMDACAQAGIPARPLPASEALAAVPGLNPRLRKAVWVPDGSFDAFRLPLSFFAAAKRLGADIRPWNEAIALETRDGRVTAARVLDRGSDPVREYTLKADYFLNAAGAWTASVAALAGLDVPVTPAAGTMAAVRGRLTDLVLSRLRPPSDGDIMVPQRGLSIIGSTQWQADSPDGLLPPSRDVELLLAAADEMIPGFSGCPLHAAWTAARPLAGRSGSEKDGRELSRDFVALDHEERDNVSGFCTLLGGKATVLRAMAEKAADLVVRRLGEGGVCRTRDFVLPSWREFYSGRSA